MKLFLALLAVWVLATAPAPAQAQMLLTGVGAPASGGGVNTTPLFLGGGTDATITAGTNPFVASTQDCPAGSVIVAGVWMTSAATVNSFSDGVNTYTISSTGPNTGVASGAMQTFATAPIGALLPAGTHLSVGLSASGAPYMLVGCFPGATARDPETDAFLSASGPGTAHVDVPANASQPQYVAFFVMTSSQGAQTGSPNLTATYTDVGGQTAINGGFGMRMWAPKLTATSGSPTTVFATYSSGGGGVVFNAAQRTVSVVN